MELLIKRNAYQNHFLIVLVASHIFYLLRQCYILRSSINPPPRSSFDIRKFYGSQKFNYMFLFACFCKRVFRQRSTAFSSIVNSIIWKSIAYLVSEGHFMEVKAKKRWYPGPLTKKKFALMMASFYQSTSLPVWNGNHENFSLYDLKKYNHNIK